jgi:hypothetical protein
MLSYLFAFLVSCQLITASVEDAIIGLKEPQLVGGVVLSKDSSKASVTKVGLVVVNTLAENITVEASNEKRERVEVIALGDKQYLIRGTGKVWVDVLAIDFKQNIFAKETKIMELAGPKPPEPPKPPQPDTPDVPDVPGDKFNNIGQRAAAITKGLANNAKLAAICKEASKQLGSNPAWTINSASDYVVTELKKVDLTGYQAFLDLVNSDIKSRWPITRGVAVDYWAAIATGLGAK